MVEKRLEVRKLDGLYILTLNRPPGSPDRKVRLGNACCGVQGVLLK